MNIEAWHSAYPYDNVREGESGMNIRTVIAKDILAAMVAHSGVMASDPRVAVRHADMLIEALNMYEYGKA